MGLNIHFKILPLFFLLVFGLAPKIQANWQKEKLDQEKTFKQLEIIDALGRNIHLKSPPERIVTVFSSNTEFISILGLSDKIVGIDALTFYPPEIAEKDKIGGRLGISLEQVVSKNPDLVILSPARQAVHTLLKPLEILKIPAVVLKSNNVQDIILNIRKLGWLTGVPEKGEEIANKMEQQLLDLKKSRQGKVKPRVILITAHLSNGLFLVSRKGSYTADMVELAGGILALDEFNEASLLNINRLSPEVLLDFNPDIILYTKRLHEGDELKQYLNLPTFSILKAQQNGDIYEVSGSEFLIPGPRVIDGISHLTNIFNAWNNQR